MTHSDVVAATPTAPFDANRAAFAELWQFRSLLRLWILREIRVRYKQSVFGSLWAILQPLSLALIFTVVFSVIVRVPTGDIPYPLFAYTGLLPWTLFATAVNTGVLSLTNNANLVGKIYFPREVLPMASMGAAFVDFLVASTVLVGMLIFYQWPIHVAVLWVVPLLAIELLTIFGVTLAGAAALVYYRDVRFLVPLALQLLFYLTPIIYPITMVPEQWRWLFALNPLAAVMAGFREAVLLGTAPNLALVAPGAVVAALTAAVGYWIFKASEGGFADII